MSKQKTTKKDFNAKSETLNPDLPQRKASDPGASVWLTANAGTGKTKVLTDRVLRLMLDGNAPEDIMCVTFTTAAAALMQKRIRRELSVWATCQEAELEKRLKTLTGKKPDTATKDRATRLFARFLEAPEGVKIQTIHALAQTIIQKFPIEAGVTPSFSVMDEEDSQNLLRDAQAEILKSVEMNPNSDLAAAVQAITPEVGEDAFIGLVREIVGNRKKFRRILDDHGGLSDTIDAVHTYLDIDPELSGADIRYMTGASDGGSVIDGPDIDGLKEAVTVMMAGSETDRKKAEVLTVWLEASAEERLLMFEEYSALFLTADGNKRKTLATKKCESIIDVMEEEARRLVHIQEEIRTANVARGTRSLLTLGDAILKSYETRKAAMNYLDYDDLIAKAGAFLADDQRADWVLDKISGELSHILVDEAQDTSPNQWAIVAALMKGVYANPGKGAEKTIFVVGDEKQSIFSFQGADPHEFMRRKKFFETLVKSNGGTWRDVDMDIPFRSTPAVLQAVDAVFKNPEAANGLKADEKTKIKHVSYRQGQAGMVEVNPPMIGRSAKSDIEPWSLPDTMEDIQETSLDMAEEIAERIKNWLDSGEHLESRNRAMIPSDIMILVRRRSEFVNYLVRALKKREVPVAGVDRMVLSEQLAVKDLLALGEVMLHPSDDYKLAVVLKSPLIGLTDKQLENLALGRDETLWERLEKKAASRAKANAPYKQAYEYLHALQEKLERKNLYSFYSDILFQSCPASDQSGLSAIYKRLGNEAEDPMVEFLNALERFKKDNPPSLQSFIRWLDAGEAEIKREMNLETAEPKVGIMTVHGAKGLEAPVVIMADTMGVPSDNVAARPRLLWPMEDRKVPLWVASTGQENAVFKIEKEKIEKERDDEYKRLLYVAMTRAADRLHVYGYQNRKDVRDMSWYNLIKKGLIDNAGKAITYSEPETRDEKNAQKDDDFDPVITLRTEQAEKPQPDGLKARDRQKKTTLPDWARIPPKPEKEAYPSFTPSQALKEQKSANDNTERKWPSPLNVDEKSFDVFQRGNATHNLLEFLPRVKETKRDETAKKFLAQSDFNFSAKQQKEIWTQVKDILDDQTYDFIFGKNSKAEVTVTGLVEVNGVMHQLNGQVDRLVVTNDEVWIIDYKSNAKIPDTLKDVPDLYAVQMAAYQHVMQQVYPDKKIRCALLWTRTPKLQELSAASLKRAAKKIGLKIDAVASDPKTKTRKSAPQKNG